jgi:hypothetical protein
MKYSQGEGEDALATAGGTPVLQIPMGRYNLAMPGGDTICD